MEESQSCFSLPIVKQKHLLEAHNDAGAAGFCMAHAASSAVQEVAGGLFGIRACISPYSE